MKRDGTMKKIEILIICFMLMLLYKNEAYGSEKVATETDMQLIDTCVCNLNISGNNAKVSFYATCNLNVSNIQIKLELQEKSGISWKTIEYWVTNELSNSICLEYKKSVEVGKKYRAVANITVKTKSKSESKTIKSSEEKAQ